KLLTDGTMGLPMPRKQFGEAFKGLIRLFQLIVQADWVDLDRLAEIEWQHPNIAQGQHFSAPILSSESSTAACDFCMSDIWNRHFNCRECSTTQPYDTCTSCYAKGRG